jgi:rRNA-processing protein FCF1
MECQYTSSIADTLIRKTCNYFFWRFQYCQRFAWINSDESWISTVNEALSWHDKKIGERDTLRYVCHAILSRILLGNSAYQLSNIPESHLPAYERIFKISFEHEYLLTDILNLTKPEVLLGLILDGKIPLPPQHFHIHNKPDAILSSELLIRLHNVKYHPVGTKEINDKIDASYKLMITEILHEELSAIENVDNQNQREKLYKLYNQTKKRRDNLNYNNMDKFSSYHEISKTISAHNSAHHTTFKDTSLSHEYRAIGIFLWDHKNLYNTKRNETHAKLDEILHKSKKYTEGQPEERKRSKLLDHANRCIQERCVLALQRN